MNFWIFSTGLFEKIHTKEAKSRAFRFLCFALLKNSNNQQKSGSFFICLFSTNNDHNLNWFSVRKSPLSMHTKTGKRYQLPDGARATLDVYEPMVPLDQALLKTFLDTFLISAYNAIGKGQGVIELSPSYSVERKLFFTFFCLVFEYSVEL